MDISGHGLCQEQSSAPSSSTAVFVAVAVGTDTLTAGLAEPSAAGLERPTLLATIEVLR
jgi:hypothetical protein